MAASQACSSYGLSFPRNHFSSPPWWERALPPWVDRPDISTFYEMVAALKGHKYSQRAAAVVSQHEDVLVQLCLLVDAIGLDRKSASKFVRLFKLVHSMDEFKNRVVEGDREVATSIVNILDVYEDSARIVKIRRSLIPVRKRTLTEAQRAGYQLLQTFERARSSQLESYAAEEKLLIEQLKALRSERDEFSRQ